MVTTQLRLAGLNSTSVRSRARMSLRVSQPLWPPSTVTSSLQGLPNSFRSYLGTLGLKPRVGRLPRAARAASISTAESAGAGWPVASPVSASSGSSFSSSLLLVPSSTGDCWLLVVVDLRVKELPPFWSQATSDSATKMVVTHVVTNFVLVIGARLSRHWGNIGDYCSSVCAAVCTAVVSFSNAGDSSRHLCQ